MLVIELSEVGHDGDGAFQVKLSFGDDAEYAVEVSDPADEAEESALAWYFEEHLRYPFLDKDREEQVVRQVAEYGKVLFGQVFGGPASYDYRRLRALSFDGCRLEVSGSAALHQLHWEALRDPELDAPLAVRIPITRKVSYQPSRFSLPDARPTLNILVVTARPDGPRDVGYRTISRPLLDALRTAGLPMTIDLVRPGTWDAVCAHLRSATERHGSGWYHVVHFDVHGAFVDQAALEAVRRTDQLVFAQSAFEGRRGFLFFETAHRATAEPVPAEAVASLLAEHRVLVAVLNACQSAMQSDSEAGLAQRLAEAGVPVAIGMAYSVTVSAATRAMPVLYRRIAEGKDFAIALAAVRRELLEHPGRQAYFGQELDLEDWMLPVMFGQRQFHIKLKPMTDPEAAVFYERQAVVADEPVTEYGFIGRDLDIQAIEHRLLTKVRNNQLLVRGMAGAGKSTLLAHLAWWWQRTGLVGHAFSFSYENQAWASRQIIRAIRSRLLPPAEHARADVLSEAAQAEQVAGLLRAQRHLLILDNTESITAAPAAIPHALEPSERDQLKDFLSRLRGGRTLVIFGSREAEEWLTANQGPGTYHLNGLDSQAASLLVDRILERSDATAWLRSEPERQALQDLILLLGGYPLPLTVVLPTLASSPPSVVLAELQTGELGPDRAGLIRRAIEYGHGRLDPSLQNSLQMLAPFTAVIATGQFLRRYQVFLLQHEAIQKLGPIDLSAALGQAVELGLAAPHPQLLNTIQVQPILPWFLRNRLHTFPVCQAATDRAHYEVYRSMAQIFSVLLISKNDPSQRNAGRIAVQAHFTNLTDAIEYGLRTNQPIDHLIGAVDEYLDQTGQQDVRRQILDEMISTCKVPSDDMHKKDLAGVFDLAGMTAFTQGRLEDADGHFRKSLALLQDIDDRQHQGLIYYRLANIALSKRHFEEAGAYYQRALVIFVEDGYDSMQASAYYQLGMVAHKRRQFREASNRSLQSLDVRLNSGDLHGAAKVYYQLGRIAEDEKRYQEAELNYRKALDIFLEFGDMHNAAGAYNQLGLVARAQEQYDSAGSNYRKALDIFLGEGDRHGVATAYHQLGMAAQDEGRFEEAESNYQKALDGFLCEGDQEGAAGCYNQLGTLAQEQQDLAKARASFFKALDIYTTLGDSYEAANTSSNLGVTNQIQKRYQEAESHFRGALDVYRKFSDQDNVALTYLRLGILNQDQERFTQAHADYRSAFEIWLEIDPLKASISATRIGIVLAQLGQHIESIDNLLMGTVLWRTNSGKWDEDDLTLLRRQRTFLRPEQFSALVEIKVPANLAVEFTIVMSQEGR